MAFLQNIKNVYLTFKESLTPANPDAGDQRLFIDSADHALKLINSSGTVSAIGSYTQGARVYNSADISISNGVETALTFNSERYDTDTIHDTGSNTSRLTCKTAGKYIIVGHVRFANNSGGDLRYVGVKLNGTTTIAYDIRNYALSATSGGIPEFTITTLYDLAINDYVELIAFQNSGGNLNVTTNANHSPEFMMQRIG